MELDTLNKIQEVLKELKLSKKEKEEIKKNILAKIKTWG